MPTSPGLPSRLSPLGVACLLAGILGAVLLWYSTRWGVGVSPDSAEYLAAARRLHGLGDLLQLPSHWPPGYPVLLKLAALAGSDLYGTTRVLQALLLIGNLVAALLLLQRVTGAGWALLAAVLVLLFDFPLLQVNFYAWSEGPFLLCQQLSTLALLRHFDTPQHKRYLLAAAATAALALLFRYAGVAWIGAASLLLLWQGSGAWQQRLRAALLFGVTAVLPFAAWMLVNKLLRDETTNRTLVVHVIPASDVLALVRQIGSWFGLQLGLLPFALIIGLALALWRRLPALPPVLRRFLCITAVHIGVYLVFIVLSKTLFDAYIPFDERIFVSSVLFSLLALLAIALQGLAAEGRGRTLAGALLGVLVLANAVYTLPLVLRAHREGSGYLSAYMATVSKVEEIPALAQLTVYSNAPDYLRMRTDYTLRDYPRKSDPATTLANPAYDSELDAMRRQVLAGEAVLVHYQGFEWRTYFPQQDELAALGYQPLVTGNGVTVLGLPGAAATAP